MFITNILTKGGHFMKKLIVVLTCQIIVWTLSITAYASVLNYSEYNKIVPQTISSPNGSFEIYIQKDANWQLVQKLNFDNFFREKTCDLSAFTEPGKTVSIRLVQKGGNAAHIDTVLMGDSSPIGKGLTKHEMQKNIGNGF